MAINADTLKDAYISLPDLKRRLDISDAQDDTPLESVINAASRWVDARCGRRFYTVTETRYYTPNNSQDLLVYDIAVNASTGLPEITSIKTDEDADRVYENTWASSDYFTLPRTPNLLGGVYEPVTEIEADLYNGDYAWPTGLRDSVEITAKFGYSDTVPAEIVEACTLYAMRIWKRKDAIFGIAGTAGLGVQTVTAQVKNDNDLMGMLYPYMRIY